MNQYQRAIKASNNDSFTAAMKDIQDIDIVAFEWMRKLNSSIGQSMILISLSTMLID